jgi:steroid 5-alpha reductase family enzyme
MLEFVWLCRGYPCQHFHDTTLPQPFHVYLQGTTAFIGSVWATHALHCSAHSLSLLQPSKSLLLAAMVSLWGARLAGFLFSRVLQVGKDARLDSFFPKDDSETWVTGKSMCVPPFSLLLCCRITV